jgi:hypothetical protein
MVVVSKANLPRLLLLRLLELLRLAELLLRSPPCMWLRLWLLLLRSLFLGMILVLSEGSDAKTPGSVARAQVRRRCGSVHRKIAGQPSESAHSFAFSTALSSRISVSTLRVSSGRKVIS